MSRAWKTSACTSTVVPISSVPEHIRRYQARLFGKRKFNPHIVALQLASLCFFYIKVSKRNWSIAETPYPKKLIRLPQILS
jgi:hypothetical protein